MQKKIIKQREKIAKLTVKETDLMGKLKAIQEELHKENKVLDNLEKERVGQFMKEHRLSAEDIINQLLDGTDGVAKGMEELEELEDEIIENDEKKYSMDSFWK